MYTTVPLWKPLSNENEHAVAGASNGRSRQPALNEVGRFDFSGNATGQCLHELIEQQAARTPEAAAVTHARQQLSYEELNAQANQLAHYLRRKGVGPEQLVGILLERSVEMAICVQPRRRSGPRYNA